MEGEGGGADDADEDAEHVGIHPDLIRGIERPVSNDRHRVKTRAWTLSTVTCATTERRWRQRDGGEGDGGDECDGGGGEGGGGGGSSGGGSGGGGAGGADGGDGSGGGGGGEGGVWDAGREGAGCHGGAVLQSQAPAHEGPMGPFKTPLQNKTEQGFELASIGINASP